MRNLPLDARRLLWLHFTHLGNQDMENKMKIVQNAQKQEYAEPT